MATIHQIREGLNDAWDTVLNGWQLLYRRAAGAITRFTAGSKGESDETRKAIAARSSGWGVLTAEVFDDDDQVIVRLEVPGMEPDEFTLEVVEDTLTVRGVKQIQQERTVGHYHISECAYGSFERTIRLPDQVDSGKASARYRRGVLHVTLPKAADRRRRRIEVTVD